MALSLAALTTHLRGLKRRHLRSTTPHHAVGNCSLQHRADFRVSETVEERVDGAVGHDKEDSEGMQLERYLHFCYIFDAEAAVLDAKEDDFRKPRNVKEVEEKKHKEEIPSRSGSSSIALLRVSLALAKGRIEYLSIKTDREEEKKEKDDE